MTLGAEVVLTDAAPAEVRAALRRCAGDAVVSDLELAVTEVVANAHDHGQPPVEVTVRVVAMQLAVTVRDGGPGPLPDAMLRLPDGDAERGRGRWLAHQLAEVRERRTPRGYEVHLGVRG